MIIISILRSLQFKRMAFAALIMTIYMSAYALTGLDLMVEETNNPCASTSIKLDFIIINNTGAPVSGPISVVMWVNGVGALNVNSPQISGNYTSAYPSIAGWN